MAEAQRTDPELQALLDNPENVSLQIAPITLPTGELTLYCDTSTGIPRPFVPASLRKIVFNSLQSLSHPGILAIRHLVTIRYVWPKIYRDDNQWTKSMMVVKALKLPDTPKPP